MRNNQIPLRGPRIVYQQQPASSQIYNIPNQIPGSLTITKLGDSGYVRITKEIDVPVVGDGPFTWYKKDLKEDKLKLNARFVEILENELEILYPSTEGQTEDGRPFFYNYFQGTPSHDLPETDPYSQYYPYQAAQDEELTEEEKELTLEELAQGFKELKEAGEINRGYPVYQTGYYSAVRRQGAYYGANYRGNVYGVVGAGFRENERTFGEKAAGLFWSIPKYIKKAAGLLSEEEKEEERKKEEQKKKEEE